MNWRYDHNRKVGTESSRSYEEKLRNGFFAKYMSGNGLEIGYRGYTDGIVPILDSAIGIDTDYPGYDGKTLPFETESQSYVYSSHCLEHIEDYMSTLREWYRVLKTAGFLVVVVPHQFLYEKKRFLPSNFNGDHKHFFTPATLMHCVEVSLPVNSYRVRLLEDNDKNYDYSLGPDKHAGGTYEITLVLQKIQPPDWKLA
jgi:SAM-dependent methyltransferase